MALLALTIWKKIEDGTGRVMIRTHDRPGTRSYARLCSPAIARQHSGTDRVSADVRPVDSVGALRRIVFPHVHGDTDRCGDSRCDFYADDCVGGARGDG